MRFTSGFISLLGFGANIYVDGRVSKTQITDINDNEYNKKLGPPLSESAMHKNSYDESDVDIKSNSIHKETQNSFLKGSRSLGVNDNDVDDAFEFPVFERSIAMQGKGCENVKWTVDMEALEITFRVESAQGSDWVSFGLSENGGMKGADVAIVKRRSTGSEFVVEDRVSFDHGLPKMDTLQNVELLHSEVRDQRIVAVLRRGLNTCDLDDLPVEPKKQYLVCASGSTTPEGEIIYPDPTSATAKTAEAVVNLMLDEDLLLDQSISKGILSIESTNSSIKTAADLDGNDYSVQFIIPGEATKEYIPSDGLQVFAVVPHMHKMGVHSRLQLIRNGIHILDVFKTLSFDFDKQVPIFKQWKLLPGDSLLMTCTYGANPEQISHVDEICAYDIVYVIPQDATATIEQITATRYSVEDNSMNSAFLGPLLIRGNDSSLETFTPENEEEHFEPIKKTNICEMFARDTFYLPVYTFAEYNLTAMITLMLSFCFCYFLGAEAVWKRMNLSHCNERMRRNTIVYFGELIYGTFALVVSIVAASELYTAGDTYDAIDPALYVVLRGTIVVQMLLYLLELFYRINVRIEVILHHGFVAAAGLVNLLALSNTFAVQYLLEINLLVFLMAVTDHPLNITLLLKNLGYAGESWWPKLCKVSGILFVVTKIIPFGLLIFVMARADASLEATNHSFSGWLDADNGKIGLRVVNIFMPILFSSLMLVQLYIGYVLWVLGCKYERNNRSKTEGNNDSEAEQADVATSDIHRRDSSSAFFSFVLGQLSDSEEDKVSTEKEFDVEPLGQDAS